MSFTTTATLYYKPSGKTPVGGIVIFLAGGIIAAWILGIVYTYVVEYIPFVTIRVIATIFFGVLLGVMFSPLSKIGKLRSPTKVTILAIVVTLVGLWLHWAFFCAFILNKYGSAAAYPLIPTYIHLLKFPSEVLHTANSILEHGHFTIGGGSTPVTGIDLAVIWVIETLIILGFSVPFAHILANSPYSETLDRWADAEDLPGTPPFFPDITATKKSLRAGDFSLILNAEKTSTAPHSIITLHVVEGDPDCCYLTLANLTVTTNKKGRHQRKTTNIVKHLRITHEIAQKLRAKFAHVTQQPLAA